MTSKHITDEVGPIEFVTEIIQFLGAKRAAEIIGHSVVWGLLGLQDKAEIIAYCQKQGIGRSTAYELIGLFQAFLHHLEVKHGWHGSLADGLVEIRAVAVQKTG